jgi:SAM-dependent methyltransferase
VAEIDILRGAWRRRLASTHYRNDDPAHRAAYYGALRGLLALLRRLDAPPLEACRIIDVGCGEGALLNTLLALGARPALLHGVDLLPERLHRARARLPDVDLRLADAAALPLPDACCDLALQFTAFTSILNLATRHAAANEIVRVLRPGGVLIWYDFWINPGRRHVRAIGRAEVRRLFPGCRCIFRRITLAPPLARLLVPRAPGLAAALGYIPALCSHELAAIIKLGGEVKRGEAPLAPPFPA